MRGEGPLATIESILVFLLAGLEKSCAVLGIEPGSLIYKEEPFPLYSLQNLSLKFQNKNLINTLSLSQSQ